MLIFLNFKKYFNFYITSLFLVMNVSLSFANPNNNKLLVRTVTCKAHFDKLINNDRVDQIVFTDYKQLNSRGFNLFSGDVALISTSNTTRRGQMQTPQQNGNDPQFLRKHSVEYPELYLLNSPDFPADIYLTVQFLHENQQSNTATYQAKIASFNEDGTVAIISTGELNCNGI